MFYWLVNGNGVTKFQNNKADVGARNNSSNSDMCYHLLDTCHSNNSMVDVLSNQCWLLVWNDLLLQCCRYSVGTNPKLFQ